MGQNFVHWDIHRYRRTGGGSDVGSDMTPANALMAAAAGHQVVR